MRLIDADKLMDSLRGNVLIDVTPWLKEVIDEQPTADVQPVKQGVWIEQRGMREFDFKFYKCSVCEKLNEIDTMIDDISNYHYCPNCGVKMEEENE